MKILYANVIKDIQRSLFSYEEVSRVPSYGQPLSLFYLYFRQVPSTEIRTRPPYRKVSYIF